jgi:hypothetical protein
MQERAALTAEQKHQVVQLRQELLKQMDIILEERQATIANLQVCAHPGVILC